VTSDLRVGLQGEHCQPDFLSKPIAGETLVSRARTPWANGSDLVRGASRCVSAWTDGPGRWARGPLVGVNTRCPSCGVRKESGLRIQELL
jgi:hypothetical protein